MVINIESLKSSISSGYARLLLWILLLLLTALILLFPVSLRFEYHTIESLYIFGDNLWLFASLYIIWLATLLMLLFTKNNEWQRVALVSIFTLVFFGFWIINTPYGNYADGMVNMGHVRYLEQTGTIAAEHPVLAYFQFPGLHLAATAFSQICGLDIFITRTISLLFGRILFAVLLYILFSKSLKDSLLASLAVLLLLQGSMMLSRTTFHPEVAAFPFFVILLIMLLATGEGRAKVKTVFFITFGALTVTYLPIPAFFIFILGGIYVLQKFTGKSLVTGSIIILCLTVFLAWEMYWASRMFTGMVGHVQDLAAAFSNLLERLLPVVGTVTTSLGENVPLWASLTRTFWLALIFVFGAILGIRNLFRFRRLDSIETMETGGLWCVLIFSGIAILAFPGGTQQSRVLMYASLFTVPIIVRFLSGLGYRSESFRSPGYVKSLSNSWGWIGRHAFILLFIVFFVLSLPTFLVNHNSVNTQTVYRHELSAGEFIETSHEGIPIHFFSDIISVYTSVYYVPDASFSYMPYPWDIADEEALWLETDRLVERFEGSSGDAIFVLTEKFSQPYRSISIVEPTDVRWLEFIGKLSKHNQIYDNGHTQIYSNQPT